MKRLRTNIVRISVIVLIGMGFGLYMLQPTQAKQSSQAFASWFSKMADSADEVELQKELNDLRESADHLEQVVKQASRIVSNNGEDFTFSFEESIESNRLYQLLLIEWSKFQIDNAMTGTPIPPTVKLFISSTVDKVSASVFKIVGGEIPAVSHTVKSKSVNITQVFSSALVPMVDEIAIGAP